MPSRARSRGPPRRPGSRSGLAPRLSYIPHFFFSTDGLYDNAFAITLIARRSGVEMFGRMVGSILRSASRAFSRTDYATPFTVLPSDKNPLRRNSRKIFDF